MVVLFGNINAANDTIVRSTLLDHVVICGQWVDVDTTFECEGKYYKVTVNILSENNFNTCRPMSLSCADDEDNDGVKDCKDYQFTSNEIPVSSQGIGIVLSEKPSYFGDLKEVTVAFSNRRNKVEYMGNLNRIRIISKAEQTKILSVANLDLNLSPRVIRVKVSVAK